MKSFRKDCSPSLNGWTIELFLYFFYLMGDDILKMDMEIKGRGKILGSLNSTFIALIPKIAHPDTLGI